MAEILTVSKLHKQYGTNTVLESVGLNAGRGELVLFTGPNGGGKTTLFHLLAGLRRADGGEMILEGEKITHLGRARKRVSLLPQNPGFQPAPSVKQTFEFYRELEQTNGESGRWLHRVGLDSVRSLPVGECSGGMVQRLAIAVAFASESPLILLDEPANHLDPEWKQWLFDTVEEKLADGKTVFVSTHRIPFWTPLNPRRFHLEDGCLGRVETQ